MNPDNGNTAHAERPSKSELKRRVERLQKAGESLIELSVAQLEKIALPDELRLAVQEAQKLRNKHAAFKRQRQYIGRLMREIDGEAVIQAVNELELAHRTQTARFHEIEYWRDALLAEDSGHAMSELLATHPGIDVQALRRQIGKARRELQSGRSRQAQRKLFAMLRDLLMDA